jgi:hypothetical protein
MLSMEGMTRALVCPQCGGTLPPRALRAVVVCKYCNASVSLDGAIVRAKEFHERREAFAREYLESGPRFTLAGKPYRLMDTIAEGDIADVFLAERAHPISERVLLHVLRKPEDEPLLRRTAETLRELARSEAAARITSRDACRRSSRSAAAAAGAGPG